MKTAIVFSGGLDSTVLSYMLAEKGTISLLTFNYGQIHATEIHAARTIAHILGAEHEIIDISGIKSLLKGSSLTDSRIPVPMKAYDKETMSLTVVPNRNAIMLSIAWGFATSNGYDAVACGVHTGDHYIYPDCRPEFLKSIHETLKLATESPNMELLTPFYNKTKAEIVKIGHNLDVPFDLTWSCYQGGKIHCGECGTCTARKQAFLDADVIDHTKYAA